MNTDPNHHPLIEIGAISIAPLAEFIAASSATELRYTLPDKLRELRKHRHWLTTEQFVAVARHFATVKLAPELLSDDSDIAKSSREVQSYLTKENRRFIYGVNTGFGSHRNQIVDSKDAAELSKNILLSHATGVGKPLAPEVVRGMLLLRLRTFAQGLSGVRLIVLQKIVELLNNRVIPFVPEKGSVGSSGDLAPLAHLFLVLIGHGKAWVVSAEDNLREPLDPAKLLSGSDALKQAGIAPLELVAKDGLALTNGTAVATSILALAAHDAQRLYHSANRSGAVSLQAVGGLTRAYSPLPHAARPHLGQLLAAREISELLSGSTLTDRAAEQHESQDDYSIRAMPQVHGAAMNAILHAREVAETELNSVTDNPLFFGHLTTIDANQFFFSRKHLSSEADKTLNTTHCSAANFHGEPIGFALDYLKIGVAELANIAERRVQLLLDKNHNRGLPADLTEGAGGLHSGFMIMQYSAAALVAENKVFCHPSSVDSIPTSANAEDHVAMSTNAARHTRMVIENTTHVLAIELLCALQAAELRIKQLKNNAVLSPLTENIRAAVRARKIPFIHTDHDFAATPPHQLITDIVHLIS